MVPRRLHYPLCSPHWCHRGCTSQLSRHILFAAGSKASRTKALNKNEPQLKHHLHMLPFAHNPLYTQLPSHMAIIDCTPSQPTPQDLLFPSHKACPPPHQLSTRFSPNCIQIPDHSHLPPSQLRCFPLATDPHTCRPPAPIHSHRVSGPLAKSRVSQAMLTNRRSPGRSGCSGGHPGRSSS